jgi:hypothetical protein
VVKRPLVPRDAERFGIVRALELGHRVQVVDVSRPTHPELPADQEGTFAQQGCAISVVDSWSDLGRHEALFHNADLVLLLNQSFGLSRTTLPVLRLLARTDTPYLISAPALYGTGPMAAEGEARKSMGELFSWLRYGDTVNSVLARVKPRWLGVPEAYFVIYNGLASMVPNNLIGPATEPVYAHTADYDAALPIMLDPPPAENIAVFLDQYVSFHPDNKVVRLRSRIDPNNYYTSLRNLFDSVEAELGLKVVIAAHPRADYSRRPGIMGPREIIQGQSSRLIARSRLVLTHVSTAVGMAIMLKKPIMLIATRDQYMLTPAYSKLFDQLSRTLGTPLHFIDAPKKVDLSAAFETNAELLNGYTDLYLRHPQAPQRQLWDHVFDQVAASLAVRKGS